MNQSIDSLKKTDLILLRLQMLKAGYGHESIDQFVNGVVAYNSLAHSELEKRKDEIKSENTYPRDIADWEMTFDDEHYFVEEAKKLAHELSIVALYKKIEITVGRAVKIAYPDAPAGSFFKIKELKNFLTNKGIDISRLSGYPGMDETRTLNNAIKHSGTVSEELANYGWTKGAPLSDLDKAYARLAPICAEYVEALLDELIKERKNASAVSK
jgi:hypothetical protein